MITAFCSSIFLLLLYEGRTESHEQVFLHANWEQHTKESTVVDGTSCCVILVCLVTSIACITWPVSLLTKWPTTICRFASVLSSNFLSKRKSLLQKFTRDVYDVSCTYLHYKSKVIHLNLVSPLLWYENKETLLPLADRTHAFVGCLFPRVLKCYM